MESSELQLEKWKLLAIVIGRLFAIKHLQIVIFQRLAKQLLLHIACGDCISRFDFLTLTRNTVIRSLVCYGVLTHVSLAYKLSSSTLGLE